MPCPIIDWHGNSCRATLACHTQHPRPCTIHLLLLLNDGGSQGSSREGHMQGHRGQGGQQGANTLAALRVLLMQCTARLPSALEQKACTLYG
jgi:hypothetical protein